MSVSDIRYTSLDGTATRQVEADVLSGETLAFLQAGEIPAFLASGERRHFWLQVSSRPIAHAL